MNLDVVAIPQASKLLLTSCVPYVEPVATVSGTILLVQFRTHSIQWLLVVDLKTQIQFVCGIT